ncbi:MAG: hypothetical protein KDB35_12620 [Acidimicrobiales bacterium]|nr:hypothetical protein [Acidimicrobiales bacterium]
MPARLHRFALRCYQRLPTLGRRWVVRTIAPSYTVGAMCVIERRDGAVLLIRHSYRSRWGVPGGLLNRREEDSLEDFREDFDFDRYFVDGYELQLPPEIAPPALSGDE